eukprot:m.60440 g.60440  ORF g.60440 m.60440 type:complete len:423 (+) comp7277_c0_seq1:112-1380(+)
MVAQTAGRAAMCDPATKRSPAPGAAEALAPTADAEQREILQVRLTEEAAELLAAPGAQGTIRIMFNPKGDEGVLTISGTPIKFRMGSEAKHLQCVAHCPSKPASDETTAAPTASAPWSVLGSVVGQCHMQPSLNKSMLERTKLRMNKAEADRRSNATLGVAAQPSSAKSSRRGSRVATPAASMTPRQRLRHEAATSHPVPVNLSATKGSMTATPVRTRTASAAALPAAEPVRKRSRPAAAAAAAAATPTNGPGPAPAENARRGRRVAGAASTANVHTPPHTPSAAAVAASAVTASRSPSPSGAHSSAPTPDAPIMATALSMAIEDDSNCDGSSSAAPAERLAVAHKTYLALRSALDALRAEFKNLAGNVQAAQKSGDAAATASAQRILEKRYHESKTLHEMLYDQCHARLQEIQELEHAQEA